MRSLLYPAEPEFQIARPTIPTLMKTHLQLLNISCTAALLFTGAALAQTPGPSAAPRMKAIVYHDYGSPDVLRLEEIEKPVPNDNQLLVKVDAVSVNPLDWHYMEGSPYLVRVMFGFGLLKPNETRLGVDYAGTVEAVGKNVTQFKPGDEVFGGKTGAFAEYICVLADRAVALKPANVTFEQAASVGIAGITALQAVRDKGKVQPGQKVLINGASGGVGTFAVQIAKSLGADVTGVCSTRNLDMVRSIGASQVIDYTKEDFTKNEQRYDLIMDNVGNHSLLEYERILNPKGKYVLIGGGGVNDGRWIGTLARPIKVLVLSPFVSQQMGMMFAEFNQKDLNTLADLMQTGKVTPVIDKTYKFSELPEAMRYLEGGHARGKVVITVADTNEASPVTPNHAAGSASATSPALIAFTFIAIVIGVTIVPIVVALVLNRRFRQRNPEKRPYRWGYYFSIMCIIGGLGLGVMLEAGFTAVVVCGLIYAVLAWFFAQRRHWAWIALTILSFNPVAWIINFFYLWKRWAEDPAATATI
jgi:NADPH:quinone reductase-like Zn-dependent oxidoreductase